MNKHVVDGEELRKFIQHQYDIMIELVKCYDPQKYVKVVGIAKVILHFEEQAKLFKVKIDFHD